MQHHPALNKYTSKDNGPHLHGPLSPTAPSTLLFQPTFQVPGGITNCGWLVFLRYSSPSIEELPLSRQRTTLNRCLNPTGHWRSIIFCSQISNILFLKGVCWGTGHVPLQTSSARESHACTDLWWSHPGSLGSVVLIAEVAAASRGCHGLLSAWEGIQDQSTAGALHMSSRCPQGGKDDRRAGPQTASIL